MVLGDAVAGVDAAVVPSTVDGVVLGVSVGVVVVVSVAGVVSVVVVDGVSVHSHVSGGGGGVADSVGVSQLVLHPGLWLPGL